MPNYPIRPNLPMLCDFSVPIGITDIAASPYRFGLIGYVPKKPNPGAIYSVSAGVISECRRLGVKLALNYEDLAANWMVNGQGGVAGGYDIGRDRGDYVADWLDQQGIANIPAVYCSADFHPTNPWEMEQAMAALRGFQESRLGRRGRALYGFAEVLIEARNRGLVDYGWMCGDGVALFTFDGNGNPDGGRTGLGSWVQLWQQNNEQAVVGGGQVDINYALADDFGQLGIGTTPAITTPIPGVDDMFNDTDRAWLEDCMRRTQQMHVNGFLPLDLTQVPHWSVGGNLYWFQQQLEGSQWVKDARGSLSTAQQKLDVLGTVMSTAMAKLNAGGGITAAEYKTMLDDALKSTLAVQVSIQAPVTNPAPVVPPTATR